MPKWDLIQAWYYPVWDRWNDISNFSYNSKYNIWFTSIYFLYGGNQPDVVLFIVHCPLSIVQWAHRCWSTGGAANSNKCNPPLPYALRSSPFTAQLCLVGACFALGVPEVWSSGGQICEVQRASSLERSICCFAWEIRSVVWTGFVSCYSWPVGCLPTSLANVTGSLYNMETVHFTKTVSSLFQSENLVFVMKFI
jgi:hypothetical protein